MRDLTMSEVCMVSGGTGTCSAEDSGNNYGGVTDTNSVASDLINIYEALVETTSYVIERVADAL